MIFGHLLLLVLTLYSSSLLAEEYDGTRIANRTIERVRKFNLPDGERRDAETLFCRPFNCERIPCLLHTLTTTSKIGAFQMFVSYGSLLQQVLLIGGGTLVPTRMWCVAALASSSRKPSDIPSPQNSNKHVRLTRNRQSQMVHISLSWRFFANFWLHHTGVALESSPSHCRQFCH
jgi:hypothetical protein